MRMGNAIALGIFAIGFCNAVGSVKLQSLGCPRLVRRC